MSLKVVNLSKKYNDKWALRDVSFDVAAGEVFGIFGRSGSGKSTLLNTIQGVMTGDAGLVYFNGEDVTRVRGEARGFTTVQNARRSIWQRISKTKSFTSRGERESRNVLHAIDTAKNAILLDDTFCTMDSSRAQEFIESIRSVAKLRGLPVIFASVNFEQIMLACDRAAVLVNGEIRQIGEPQEIYEKPDSRFVADAIGRNNLFSARRLTSSKADVPEFQTVDGGHRLFAQRIERGGLGALNQNVTLAIRPEQISISFGASFPEDNLLKATVKRIRFLGPTSLVELDADGLKLQVLVLRLVGLNIGDECMVALPPDRIQIFKD
ncbi:MAG TPA: ABC transporter ATP-binding protein [Pyrinomonadaceae bacterium]|nr:ABC transporter ATP-binding protein [Pyrinomonadaceae bacterium]